MHLGAVLEAYERGEVLLTGHEEKNKKKDDPESSSEGGAQSTQHTARPTEVFKDDLNGQPLNPQLVKAARKKELDYFNSKGVWVKRDWYASLAVTGKKADHCSVG